MIQARRVYASVVRARIRLPLRWQSVSSGSGGINVAGGREGTQARGVVQPVAGGTRGGASDGAGRPAAGGYAPGEGSRSFAPTSSPAKRSSMPRSMADRTAASAALARDRTPPEMLAGDDLRAAGRVENISVANERANSDRIGPATEGIPVGPGAVLGKEGQPGLDALYGIGGVRVKGQGGEAPLSGQSSRQNSGSGDLNVIAEVNRRARADYIGQPGSSADMDVAGDAAIGVAEYPANPQAISKVPRAPWSPTSNPSGQ